ncbi:thiamine-phosphate kinase [Ferrovibrio sp.]|uniref:thiamine-phosphate kinase n=1 Tax=Ferrovibrio sp. TaxID=1917215 RepID=UPI001B62EB0F|nr:thiamine-phosphate kinase [Ferrovibrio sp.]MBP7066185.1 thiamine-phosphate kinase [Ferrovibrio sp.]
MPLGEFDLIAHYLAPLSAGLPGAFSLTDDAAALPVPPGHELVVTTDAFIAGIHFLDTDGPGRIAQKLLRVNLSDLAAKGATPYAYQLVLGLPAAPDAAWLAAFTAGLAEDQARYGIRLSGGDTVRAPGGLMLSLTALGLVPQGGMIRRSAALAGDGLFVTGSIGDAWLGLQAKLGRLTLPEAAGAFCDTRLHLPEPRLGFGLGMRGLARAAMDVSDGLLQDAGHMARQAGLMVEISAADIPLSAAALAAGQPLTNLLAGGDDYEILLAAPPEAEAALQSLARDNATQLTRIGRFLAAGEGGDGLRLLDAAGQPMLIGPRGYQHF